MKFCFTFETNLKNTNMKKIYLMGLTALLGLSVNAQNSKKKSIVGETISSHSISRKGNQLNKTAAIIWSDDFSNSANWATSQDAGATTWTFGTNTGQGTYSIAPIASTSAANGFALFDSDFGCDGDQIAHMTNATAINCTGHANVRLGFQQQYRRWYDSTYIYVSNNGTSWTQYRVNTPLLNDDFCNGNPENILIDISAVAGNQATVWVRWTFWSPASLGANAGCAYNWMIDDAFIEDIPAYDAAVSGITVPNPDCDLTSSEKVTLTINNLGANAISGFPVSYIINGGAPVIQTYTGSIAPGASGTYTFTGVNLSTAATVFTVVGAVNVTSDANLTNNVDTAYTAKLVPSVDTLSNDLEAQTALVGWEFAGNNPSAWYLSGNNHTSGGAASIAFNNGGAITSGIDEYMISSCVNLTSGTSYYIQYWANVPTSTLVPSVVIETKIGTDNTVAAMTTSIGSYTVLSSQTTYSLTRHNFTVPTSGTYNIGFRATSNGTNTAWFRMDDIVLGKNVGAGIKSYSLDQTISLFPNPTSGLLNVNTKEANTSLEVYNMIGEKIYSNNLVKGNNTIDLSGFSNGSYFVKIFNNNQTTTKKIILSK